MGGDLAREPALRVAAAVRVSEHPLALCKHPIARRSLIRVVVSHVWRIAIGIDFGVPRGDRESEIAR